MSSSVFFKFKSSKDYSRVIFDGTGISVFEIKKEIIIISGLGDGTDFDLAIYNEDSNEEYEDDTTIIPRSTSVVARRLPASKPGQGRAARYVSGKMPVNAKNSYRVEQTNVPPSIQKPLPKPGASGMSSAQTEEEKIAAMFSLGADQWEQQKQHMSSATAVHRPGAVKGKLGVVPDHEPPPGYICYRCGQKGHWIQACPTNNDPTFDGRPRVKRTTGIPKSFLQTIEKPAALSSNDGLTDDSRQPSGVMVDADGNFVVSVPDTAAWEQYQAKAQASAAQQDVAATGSKELRDRGLECSIDKRLFVDPMKTPCCGSTYCNDCIENALVNSDLVCPGCLTEGVLIDNLVPDEDTIAKIKAFEEEKKGEKKELDAKAESGKPSSSEVKSSESTNGASPAASVKSPQSPTTKETLSTSQASIDSPKKRSADHDLENDRKGIAPTLSSSTTKENSASSVSLAPKAPDGSDQDFIKQMNALAGTTNMPMSLPFFTGSNDPFVQAMNSVGFPGMPMNPQMLGLNPQMMGMSPQMMNQMMMTQGLGMPVAMQSSAFPSGSNIPNGGFPQHMQWQGWNMANGNMQQQGGFAAGQQQYQQPQGPQFQQTNRPRQNGGIAHQQMGQGASTDEDNAYMRKPMNPHRHQGRQKKARPADYREL